MNNAVDDDPWLLDYDDDTDLNGSLFDLDPLDPVATQIDGWTHTPGDPLADSGLFDVDKPPPITLADRFTMPPFSVLDRRAGPWQDRKRRWLTFGIQSEIGRNTNLAFAFQTKDPDFQADLESRGGGTSIFDPVLCELVYRWFSRAGATILDPFAGGSVRGITAGILERHYTGIDLRPEQITANQYQATTIAPPVMPAWHTGDATNMAACLDGAGPYDLVFSCPPYGDLEVYSDNPQDLSTMGWTDFVAAHQHAITDACQRLRNNRYAAWVIGDLRDPAGAYRGLHHATVTAFNNAGLRVLNEAVILSPLGTIPVRAGRPFEANRKLANAHQHLLIFVKGDIRKAAEWAGGEGQ